MKFKNEYVETDNLTGEVLAYKTSLFKKSKVDEPKFVKLFIDDISAIYGMTTGATTLLYAILREMDYNGLVNLILTTKERIAERTGLKIKHIEKCIMELKKFNVLNSRGRATYVINPMYFGKGDWNNIQSIKMTIVYDENGRMIDVVKEKKKPIQKQLNPDVTLLLNSGEHPQYDETSIREELNNMKNEELEKPKNTKKGVTLKDDIDAILDALGWE